MLPHQPMPRNSIGGSSRRMVINLWCSESNSRFGLSSLYWCCILDLINFDSLNMFFCNIWRTSIFFVFGQFCFSPVWFDDWFIHVFFFSASPFSWHLKKEGLFLYVKFSFPPQEMAWKHQKRHAIQLTKKHWFWKGMMWILLWIAGEMECETSLFGMRTCAPWILSTLESKIAMQSLHLYEERTTSE